MKVQNGKRVPQIGEVYFMYFDGTNNEQKGGRPGIILQNNMGNVHSPNIIALPITSSIKKVNQPTHVLLRASDTGLRMDSMVLCENPRCMSKDCVGNYITKLPDYYMRQIAEAHLLATAAIAYLDIGALESIRIKALALNVA